MITMVKDDYGLNLRFMPVDSSGQIVTNIVSAVIKLKIAASTSQPRIIPMTFDNNEPKYKLTYTTTADDSSIVGVLNVVITVTRQSGSVMSIQKPIQINIINVG